MNDRELVIALHQDGMSRRLICQKMEINQATLREYLGEPAKHQAPRKPGKPPRHTPSPARMCGEDLLSRSLPAIEVHAILLSKGHSVAYSTVCRWSLVLRGRVNNRVPSADYPKLRELIAANPEIKGMALSKLYQSATGRRLDRRAAHHWCRKVRAAA